MSHSHIEAHNLLHLELDGGLDLVNLLLHIFARSKEGGELTRLGETRSQKTRDLLDHVVRGKEEVILLGKFLHKLLVLVELLEILDRHLGDLDTISLFAVGGIAENAALDVGTGNFGQAKGTGETFVTLRIVVLQSDLKLNGFGEVTLLSLELDVSLLDGFTGREGKDVVDGLVEDGGVQLVGHDEMLAVVFVQESIQAEILFPSNDWSRLIYLCWNNGENNEWWKTMM